MSAIVSKFGQSEMVYVESEWYDGPRAGISDINGIPHRFQSLFDAKDDEYLGAYVVWPIDEASLRLEVEQWCIFVEWNLLYEAGKVSTDSHPSHGGLNPRWDELEALLKGSRSIVPANAKKAIAEYERIERKNRYEFDGPDYKLRWCIL